MGNSVLVISTEKSDPAATVIAFVVYARLVPGTGTFAEVKVPCTAPAPVRGGLDASKWIWTHWVRDDGAKVVPMGIEEMYGFDVSGN
jgi:hypothetical protein